MPAKRKEDLFVNIAVTNKQIYEKIELLMDNQSTNSKKIDKILEEFAAHDKRDQEVFAKLLKSHEETALELQAQKSAIKNINKFGGAAILAIITGFIAGIWKLFGGN